MNLKNNSHWISKIVNKQLKKWIQEVFMLCTPMDVYICDGSQTEYNQLMSYMIAKGMAIPLQKRSNSFLFRSDPSDVARIESQTYISYLNQDQAGPTNNWMAPDKLKHIMLNHYKGCMKGHIMYVIPFSMGPIGSPFAKIGIEITDSPYVVCNMHIMTRVGNNVLKELGSNDDFIHCLHSVGAPLSSKQYTYLWPCAPIEQKYITHFPEENLIWSYGSGYGGNALLGKKCLALRIASTIARREFWMAEHMFILCLTNPEGRQFYIAGALPSACGKSNLAMLVPTIPGWKVECIGDDIAWMKIGLDGQLYAINPEAGFFGVAPGTSYDTNPVVMNLIKKNVIFTNCALTDDHDVWWELMGPSPNHVIDWKGNDWTPDKNYPAAHPNARFTVSASQCSIISPNWQKHHGVPIDIFIFGGRRASVIPLVYEAYDWDHGVFMGATTTSETTTANIGVVGKLRRDPFAMLPFCGYHMGEYFAHWFAIGDKLGINSPRIFYVNWFRKDVNGKWLWPGFGDNSRILKWMCNRIESKVDARKTAIGLLPYPQDLDTTGLKLSVSNLNELFKVDIDAWRIEYYDIASYFNKFGKSLPKRLWDQLTKLHNRLG